MQDINEQFLQIIEAEELRSLPSTGVTAADLQNIVNEHSLEDLDPDKDDAYLLHLIAPEALDDDDDDSVDPEGIILHESKALSIPQRLKRATNLRRLSKRYSLLRKIKAKRMASPDRLNMRARKAALMSLRKKFLGNKKYSELSPQQKIQVDQELERRYGNSLGAIVRRLAQKLLSMVRRKEMGRVEKVRSMAEAKKEDKDDVKKDEDDVKKDKDSDEHEDDGDDKRYGRKHLHSRGEHSGGDRFYLNRRGSRSASLEEARKGSAAEVADEGDTGIIFQLRKAKNMKGNFDIKWGDGTKSRLPIQHVNAALLKIAQLVNRSGPGAYGLDKHKLIHKMGKSEDDFYKAMDLHEGTVRKFPLVVHFKHPDEPISRGELMHVAGRNPDHAKRLIVDRLTKHGYSVRKVWHRKPSGQEDLLEMEDVVKGKQAPVDILISMRKAPTKNEKPKEPFLPKGAQSSLQDISPVGLNASGLPTRFNEHNEVGSTEAAKRFAADTPGQTGDFSPHPLSAPVPWEDIPATHEELLKRLKKM